MAQIRCTGLLLAEAAHVRDDKLYILGVLTGMTTRTARTSFPTNLQAVSIWRGPKNTETSFRLRITGPHHFSESLDATLPFGPNGRAYSILGFEGFEFPDVGEYAFSAYFEDELQASEDFVLMPDVSQTSGK